MNEFGNQLRNLIYARGFALAEDIDAINEQLVNFPTSAELWVLRGDLIQLCDDCVDIPLDDELKSYQNAVRYEPTNPDGYEEIAHFLDKIEDKPQEAEPFFRKAIALGAGKSAHDGLAQVLEQLEKSE